MMLDGVAILNFGKVPAMDLHAGFWLFASVSADRAYATLRPSLCMPNEAPWNPPNSPR